jgi:hypothetical protein
MRIKAIEISDEAADVLRRGTWAGPAFTLPAGQLDRKLYEAVDRALRALGGKWNRTARAHLFPADRAAELIAALDQGSVVDQKKTLEQFFTPADLARQLVELAQIGPEDRVLEPSAGSGRLIEAMIAAGVPRLKIAAVEIDPDLADELDAGLAFVLASDFLAVPELAFAPERG